MFRWYYLYKSILLVYKGDRATKDALRQGRILPQLKPNFKMTTSASLVWQICHDEFTTTQPDESLAFIAELISVSFDVYYLEQKIDFDGWKQWSEHFRT
jgi:hypothetical protein